MTTDLRELSDRFLRGAATAEEEAALIRGLLRYEASGAALEPSSEGSYTAVLDRIAARVPELVDRPAPIERRFRLRAATADPRAVRDAPRSAAPRLIATASLHRDLPVSGTRDGTGR